MHALQFVRYYSSEEMLQQTTLCINSPSRQRDKLECCVEVVLCRVLVYPCHSNEPISDIDSRSLAS